MRLLAIADPHGCHDKLVELLDKVKYNPEEDKLILLGDYVDRGKHPMKTLFLVGELIEKGAIALEGNHDNILKTLIKQERLFSALCSKYYIEIGTDITVKDYYTLKENDRDKINSILDKLIPYYVYEDYIFVHAGVNSELPIEKNDPYDLRWLREEFYKNPAYENKTIIFGHNATPFIREKNDCSIWHDPIHEDKIGIDCACVYGGFLSCIDLTNKIEYYV